MGIRTLLAVARVSEAAKRVINRVASDRWLQGFQLTRQVEMKVLAATSKGLD